MTLQEQIEFLKQLEGVAENALELGIPTDWTGEDTLKVSKIRNQLEVFQRGGRPKKWKTTKEKNDFYNAKRRGKSTVILHFSRT